jgi:acyl-coenzyme A synthetase/AMP-(fatty) acid ligase
LDQSETPAAIRIAPVFNVAVPFVDRHVEEGRGAKVAIRTIDEEVTYAELAERVNRCGNALKNLGIEPGERILMMVKDCPEFIYLFFGAIKAGMVPVPVNTMLRVPDYSYLIGDSGCVAVVYCLEFADVISAALEDCGHRPGHVMTTIGADSLASRMADASDELAPSSTAPDDDCFWLYSSGSTGNPKGVVHGHADMIYTGQCFAAETAGLTEDDSYFSVSKLFHSYGFGNALTFPLWLGGTCVLSDRRVNPDMAFEIIEQMRPTIFFGIPTLYAQQLQYMETASPDTSSIRL